MLVKALGALAVVTAMALPASATTFNFTSGATNTSQASVLFGPIDGLTVTVTAGTMSGGNYSQGGQVFYGSSGLGASTYSGDGVWVDGDSADDVLIFSFNQSVSIDSVTFNYWDQNDDFHVFTDGSLADSNEGCAGFGLCVYSNTGSWGTLLVLAIGADGDGSTTNGYGSADDFKIYSMDVTAAIPEPASWLMMIMGFGLVGLAARRRSAILAA